MTIAWMRVWLVAAVAVAATVMPSGCGRFDVDEDNANEGIESAQMSLTEGTLIASTSEDDGAGCGITTAADLAAAAVAAGATRFQPAGCASVSASDTTLTYTLNECTGRLGLVHVSGTLVAQLTDGSDGVHIAVSGTGLKANRATFDLNATAVLSSDGGKCKLVVSTNGSGTTARGNTFSRVGTYTVERDSATACVSLDGQWQLDLSIGRTRSTTATGLARCADACPAAGGTIVHTGLLGRTVTVTFDGSDVASWTSSTGRSGTIDLACGSF
jgi:hypothetical protein